RVRSLDFRDRSVAAPLKLPVLDEGDQLGRISATARARPHGSATDYIYPVQIFEFPRPIGRGPIDAASPRRSPTRSATFPRPIGRGPIEAPWNQGTGITRSGISATDRSRPH